MTRLSAIRRGTLPARTADFASREAAPSRWGFPEFFVISQTVLPALLYLPGTQPLRVLIRISPYAISLGALGWWYHHRDKASRSHPAGGWLLAAVAYLVLMIFHPTTNTLLAGAAQTALYLAVLAPLFWASNVVRDPKQLWRLLAIILVCNGINAVVGILQVYDPDHWLPKEYSVIATAVCGNPLAYVGKDGQQIVRPPGLSDSPGAVCGPAATAALLGLLFCANSALSAWRRIASMALAFAGVVAIYLSQVRSSLIVVVASVLAYAIVLFLQGERRRMSAVLGLATALIVCGLTLAILLGGSGVSERFETLISEDPQTVYYTNRGNQVEYALQELWWQYPIGAGLGRWGMMRMYFGDEANTASPPIWAEIQIPAWILDGGIPLILLYGIAVGWAVRYEWSAARHGAAPNLRAVAAAVLASNFGTLLLLLSYTPFVAPVGMQYWFLSGALYGAARAGINQTDEAAR